MRGRGLISLALWSDELAERLPYERGLAAAVAASRYFAEEWLQVFPNDGAEHGGRGVAGLDVAEAWGGSYSLMSERQGTAMELTFLGESCQEEAPDRARAGSKQSSVRIVEWQRD